MFPTMYRAHKLKKRERERKKLEAHKGKVCLNDKVDFAVQNTQMNVINICSSLFFCCFNVLATTTPATQEIKLKVFGMP